MKDKIILRTESIYKNGFGIVPKAVMLDRDLTLESKAIYAYLCSMAGSGDRAFPYRDTMLRQLRIGKDAYYRHYNLLISEGYLSVQRPSDKTAANIYTLISNPKKISDLPKKKTGIHGTLRYSGLKAHGYGILPRSVMTDERLTIKAKGLYAYFCSFCGAGDSAFPRRKDILYHLNISEPTYYKCYSQLVETGRLTVVQRINHTKFGVNDYYLNEFIKGEINALEESFEDKEIPDKPIKKPCPKNPHMKSNLPFQNFTDIVSPYPKNTHNLFNNSNINNSFTNISQSNAYTYTRKGTDGSQVLENIFSKLPLELMWVNEMPPENREALLEKFRNHISAKIKSKRIRNLTGYLKVSMFNWLRDIRIKEGLAAPRYSSGRPPGKASYDMNLLETMIEKGIF